MAPYQKKKKKAGEVNIKRKQKLRAESKKIQKKKLGMRERKNNNNNKAKDPQLRNGVRWLEKTAAVAESLEVAGHPSPSYDHAQCSNCTRILLFEAILLVLVC
ncbi:hypothetical protein CDAR_297141 [Caerostris darwini]|uniref:Uncharacterized protein n=1 Tax=Caerostris darwini TaxID=1538125 RepID=A0AAV4QF42_9ARAC|nr:hypothetical protein CDAR_297141 [Caerostris darwini]